MSHNAVKSHFTLQHYRNTGSRLRAGRDPVFPLDEIDIISSFLTWTDHLPMFCNKITNYSNIDKALAENIFP